MTCVATLKTKRMCLSGYKEGTLYGYGATPEKAKQEISEYLARVNKAVDRSTPIIISVGDFQVRSE